MREAYRTWRPTPLYRARRLEQALDTPARIYYKYEGVSPTDSHKPDTAVAQAFYSKEAGVARLATETGAGQRGSSLACAGTLFGLEVKVWMVRVSFDQKPYRKAMTEPVRAPGECFGSAHDTHPSMRSCRSPLRPGPGLMHRHDGSARGRGDQVSGAPGRRIGGMSISCRPRSAPA